MEELGINFNLLLIQLFFGIGHLLFFLVTFFDLKSKQLPFRSFLLWLLIIVSFAYLGPLLYWLVKPTSSENK